MSKNHQFFIGTLEVSVGEQTFKVSRLIVANSRERAELVLDAEAQSYRDGKKSEHPSGFTLDGGYYSDGGEVFTKAGTLNSIGYASFCELNTILPMQLDVNITLESVLAEQDLEGTFKSAAASLYNAMFSSREQVTHSSLLNVLAASFGQKNWHILRSKLNNIAPQEEGQQYSTEPSPGEYDVNICRIGFGNNTIRVTATSAADAEEKAQDIAGNYLYSEKDSEYITNSVTKVS